MKNPKMTEPVVNYSRRSAAIFARREFNHGADHAAAIAPPLLELSALAFIRVARKQVENFLLRVQEARVRRRDCKIKIIIVHNNGLCAFLVR